VFVTAVFVTAVFASSIPSLLPLALQMRFRTDGPEFQVQGHEGGAIQPLTEGGAVQPLTAGGEIQPLTGCSDLVGRALTHKQHPTLSCLAERYASMVRVCCVASCHVGCVSVYLRMCVCVCICLCVRMNSCCVCLQFMPFLI